MSWGGGAVGLTRRSTIANSALANSGSPIYPHPARPRCFRFPCVWDCQGQSSGCEADCCAALSGAILSHRTDEFPCSKSGRSPQEARTETTNETSGLPMAEVFDRRPVFPSRGRAQTVLRSRGHSTGGPAGGRRTVR